MAAWYQEVYFKLTRVWKVLFKVSTRFQVHNYMPNQKFKDHLGSLNKILCYFSFVYLIHGRVCRGEKKQENHRLSKR